MHYISKDRKDRFVTDSMLTFYFVRDHCTNAVQNESTCTCMICCTYKSTNDGTCPLKVISIARYFTTDHNAT
jgi:hypothetical protein